jgi:hypothetical protein
MRLAAPVLGDKGEQAVLYLVPLAGARRQMGDRDGDSEFVGHSFFHRRTRAPLLPPQSAFISSRVAMG